MSVLQSHLFFFLIFVTNCPSWAVEINRFQLLDDDYQVEWRADLEKKNISFLITAKTLGYIGFGLYPKGDMQIADIILGGIKDGMPYFADYNGVANLKPEVDKSQDWKLLSATENSTHTTLMVTRPFNTCDKEDIPINNDTTRFIWSIGATDEITKDLEWGFSSVIILDKAICEWNVSESEVWHINVKTKLPAHDTVYWCTAHKSPFTDERQVVGFKVILDSQEAQNHTHHLILHHCLTSTQEITDLYEQVLKTPGGLCYGDQKIIKMRETCRQYMYGWAVGATPAYLPENVGVPLKEDGFSQYFLLEIHYDNPKKLLDLKYGIGIELQTTTKLREHKAGFLTVGHATNYKLMIPPNTSGYVIAGHCSGRCTNDHLPLEGINVVSVFLHSHQAGRKMKLRHFRNEIELPWLAYDDNYDFNYQQNRMLPEYIKIFKGDHLTYECTDESADRSPRSAVLGGLSTRDEMCLAFLTYYPRVKFDYCGSYVSKRDYATLLEQLGIYDIDWNTELNPLVKAPPEYAGRTLLEVLSNLVHWNETLKVDIQNRSRFGEHDIQCYPHQTSGKTVYPDVRPYEPTKECTHG